jgi:hypothetical protein
MHRAPRRTGRRSSSSNPAADGAGARRGGHCLDHGSGRSNTDYDPDAGEAGNGGEGQSRFSTMEHGLAKTRISRTSRTTRPTPHSP